MIVLTWLEKKRWSITRHSRCKWEKGVEGKTSAQTKKQQLQQERLRHQAKLVGSEEMGARSRNLGVQKPRRWGQPGTRISHEAGCEGAVGWRGWGGGVAEGLANQHFNYMKAIVFYLECELMKLISLCGMNPLACQIIARGSDSASQFLSRPLRPWGEDKEEDGRVGGEKKSKRRRRQ